MGVEVAFYCADLENFLLLLDGWLKYKETEIAREQPFQVQLRPHTSVDIDIDTDVFNYEHYFVKEKACDLPLHVFDAYPVVGKRITTLNLQIVSDTVLDLVITGHTYPFRAALEAHGIQGGYQEGEGGVDKGQYVRVWKSIDISEDDTKIRFMEMLSTTFKKLCLRVNLDGGEAASDTHMANFIEKLKENHTLFFMQKQK